MTVRTDACFLRIGRNAKLFGLGAAWFGLASCAWGQNDNPVAETSRFVALPIEELLRTEVSSVLKHSSELSEAPAAITVIRREDVERLAATNLPDLLRVVPGLQVAQIDGNKWAISSRGFNGFFSGKLLVLVDGRSVYNSIYSGVFWDVQDIPFDNIDRIEVIRGPGAALWGANAVNGVINIVTRAAQQTIGGQIVVQAGNLDKGSANARLGIQTEEGTAIRLYGQDRNRNEMELASGRPPGDTTRNTRVGFRADSAPTPSQWMISGEAYEGQSGGAPYPQATTQDTRGHHLLSRLTERLGEGSSLHVLAYADHAWRRELVTGSTLEQGVLNLDFQHTLDLNAAHRIVWGGGWRQYHFESQASAKLAFVPANSRRNVSHLFAQDEWVLLPEKLTLVAGTRLEADSHYPLEWQPNLRLAWTPTPRQTFWTSLAQATRAPNQYETTIRFVDVGKIPAPVHGNPNFQPERELSLELGWRVQISPLLSSDLAIFQTRYRHLQTIQFDKTNSVPGYPLTYLSTGKGMTHGLEWALDWQAANSWQLRSGLTFYGEKLAFETAPTPGAAVSYLGSYPNRQVFVRSLWDINERQRLDLTWRAVSAGWVPGYGTLDGRWTWRLFNKTDLSIVGRNLVGPLHREYSRQPFFQETWISRELMAQVSWSL